MGSRLFVNTLIHWISGEVFVQMLSDIYGLYSASVALPQGKDCLTWCYVFVPYFGDPKFMLGKSMVLLSIIKLGQTC